MSKCLDVNKLHLACTRFQAKADRYSLCIPLIDCLSFCVLQVANLSLYLIAYVVFLILPASQPCDVQRQVMIIKTRILFLQSEIFTPTIYTCRWYLTDLIFSFVVDIVGEENFRTPFETWVENFSGKNFWF